MHWLYFLIGVASLALAMFTNIGSGFAVVLVLVALGFFLAWMLSWMSSRVGDASRDDMQILSPEELRKMREQAEARRQQNQNNQNGDQ
jgi:membrane glycosyltransferase